MRITHLVAAAAVAAGMITAAPAAQAAPVASPAAHSWHADSSDVAAAARSAKAKTKINVTAPTEVKAGDDITIKATLKRKSGSTYKAYAKKKLELVLLDAPGAETGTVVDTAKTSKKGKVTFVGSFDDSSLGDHDFLVAYEGGSKAKASESDVFTITVTS